MRHPGGMSAEKNSGCETSEWNSCKEGFREWDTRIEWWRRRIPGVGHPDEMVAKKNSGSKTPGGMAAERNSRV